MYLDHKDKWNIVRFHPESNMQPKHDVVPQLIVRHDVTIRYNSIVTILHHHFIFLVRPLRILFYFRCQECVVNLLPRRMLVEVGIL